MIFFEFRIDENTLAEDLEMDPRSANEVALQETYFEMPVRLLIDGVDLLEIPESQNPWLTLPLLDIAKVGMDKVQKLREQKESIYYLPGGWELKFKLTNERVTIFSKINRMSVEINYKDLLEAFKSFADKVILFLCERVPVLGAHSYWGGFLKGCTEI